MSEHRNHQIADFLAGRLEEAERREFEEHMKACPECSADLSWARELREQALRQGLRHLAPMRIVELAADRQTATGAEGDHLAQCRECGKEIDWAGSLSEPAEGEEEDEDAKSHTRWTPTTGRSRRRSWTWAGLAAAAALLLFVLIPSGSDRSLAELAQVEPLPVRITRSVPVPDSFEDRRLRGLEAYSAGDYVAAAAQLAGALELRPADAEMLLYLGSTFLLQDQPESAADMLGGPAVAATDTALRDEAAWQLANSLLLAGRGDEAERTLQVLSDREGRRRTDALALLEAVRSQP